MERHLPFWVGAGLLLAAGAGWGAVRYVRAAKHDLPTAEVKREGICGLRGDPRRGQSSAVSRVTAPSSAGDILIVKLLKSGTNGEERR